MKLNKEDFDKVFNLLKENYVLLLSRKEIKTMQDVYYATKIYYKQTLGINCLYWQGFGAGCYSYTKRDLHFMTEHLFKDFNYYIIIPTTAYDAGIERYINREED